MLPFEDRFTRQRQLREVGLAGQRRIETSRVTVGLGAADGVAADYLARAGVQVEVTADAGLVGEPELAQARAVCSFVEPIEYVAGAITALNHLRTVLGVASAKS